VLSNKILRTFCAAWLGLAYAGCGTTDQTGAEDALGVTDQKHEGEDIQQALSALSGASVLATQDDQVTPSFIKGNLGQVSQGLRGVEAQAALANVAAVYRMRAQDLVHKSTSTDSQGHTYLRYSQTKNGKPVVGAELLLMVNPQGTVYAANSSAYDVAQGIQVATNPSITAEAAEVAARGSDLDLRSESTGRLVYVHGENGKLVLARETIVTG
jgi:vibriolysin